MTALAAALAGLAAGAIHVAAGADHLAAVAPLAADGRRRAWRAGYRWGVGHAGGVALVGIAALLAREVLPIEAVGSWSERGVGVVLIGIGVWAGARAVSGLRDPDAVGGHVHSHGDAHGLVPHGRGHRHLHAERAALAVGLLHGTAGAAHLVGILPALALPTPGAAGAYLGAFGVGTVAAMTLFAAVVGEASARLSFAGRRAWAGMTGAFGAASVAVGVVWLVG